MTGKERERIQGVDFTDITPLLEELAYPISATELVDRLGHREVERTNAGPITIRSLFEPMGEDTIESVDGARSSILSLMPRDSEGRQRYSDRGLVIDPTSYDARADRSGSNPGARPDDADDRR